MLRIRSNEFYRIELSHDHDEDDQIIAEFKRVLADIAQYEKTACPFERGFYVELPDSPETPKRPWRPKHTPSSPTPVVLPEKTEAIHNIVVSIPPKLGTSKGTSEGREDSPALSVVLQKNDEAGPTTTTSSADENRLEKFEQLVAGFEERNRTESTRKNSTVSLSQSTESIADEGSPREPLETQIVHSNGPSNKGLQNKIDSTAQQEVANLPDPDESINAPSQEEKIKPNETNETPIDVQPTLDLDPSETNEASEQSNEKAPTAEEPIRPEKPGNAETTSAVDITTFRWLDDPEDLLTPVAVRPSAQTRSVTAPLSLSSHQGEIVPTPKENLEDPETTSIASSIESFESFHSFHSPTSPIPPSPPLSESSSPSHQLSIDVQRIRPHKRDASELTIKADRKYSPVDMSTPTWPGDDSPVTPMPRDFLPIPEDEDSERRSRSSTPNHSSRSVSPTASIRRRFHQRRAHSPLPPPANIYIPRQARFPSGHLSSAILQKTCSLLLGPPVQLVALMLNIAAKIAAGSLPVQTFTYNESGQPIPCSWAEDEDEDEDEDEARWEDDYGISLGGTPETRRKSSNRSPQDSSSWDID